MAVPVCREPGAQSPRLWFPQMRCAICGERVCRWQPFNFDHAVPMSLGGKRGKKNKQFAHALCNSVKNNRHPFSLRTVEEREAVRLLVRPETYSRLQQVWAGR